LRNSEQAQSAIPSLWGGAVSSLLELRLERIKRFSNLRLQLLQSVYVHDGRTCAELYMDGSAVIHIHGVVGATRFCARLQNVNSILRGGLRYCEFPVFVGVGEVSNQLCPITSIIRLQLLDSCDMFSAQTFEIASAPTPEDILAVLDRKLSFLLNRAGIKACKLIDEIIEGRPQVIDDFPNENLDDMRNFGDFNFERSNDIASLVRRFWLTINDNTIAYSLAEDVNPTIQIRQVFICPSNPLISAIEWVHSKTIQRNERIV